MRTLGSSHISVSLPSSTSCHSMIGLTAKEDSQHGKWQGYMSMVPLVHIVKAMIFPVVMYRCEIWIIKKAECWRIDGFKPWYWRKLLSPLDCREMKPVNPKESHSWISAGRLRLMLKLQYFGHLMQRTTPWKRPWCWERLKTGGEGDNRRRDGWMASLT